MTIFVDFVGIGCIALGVFLLALALFQRSSRDVRFQVRDLFRGGRHLRDSSRLQLALEGILGVVLGVLVLKLL